MKRIILLVSGALAVLLTIASLFIFIVHIDAGHVGVEVNSCSSGGVNQVPVGVGYHVAGPCTRYVKFPTYQQTLILCASPHEGSKTNESITVTSSEGLPINTDVSLSFTVDPAKAPAIYNKFRLDMAHIKNVFIRQTVREAMQETFAKYTAQQLYSDRREQARAEAQTAIASKILPDGFVVTQFTINETRIPPNVQNAIQLKVAMVQQAQQAEQAIKKAEAEGRMQVVQYEATARATKAQAEGLAAATKAKAEAEAWANERLTKSLSPALIQYLTAKQWNGVLPQVTSSSIPFLNLSTK